MTAACGVARVTVCRGLHHESTNQIWASRRGPCAPRPRPRPSRCAAMPASRPRSSGSGSRSRPGGCPHVRLSPRAATRLSWPRQARLHRCWRPSAEIPSARKPRWVSVLVKVQRNLSPALHRSPYRRHSSALSEMTTFRAIKVLSCPPIRVQPSLRRSYRSSIPGPETVCSAGISGRVIAFESPDAFPQPRAAALQLALPRGGHDGPRGRQRAAVWTAGKPFALQAEHVDGDVRVSAGRHQEEVIRAVTSDRWPRRTRRHRASRYRSRQS